MHVRTGGPGTVEHEGFWLNEKLTVLPSPAWLFLHNTNITLNNIPKEYDVLFTLYIFPDTQKYSLHFECLAGQENCQIHSLIKRVSLVIPISTDLADFWQIFTFDT